MEVGINFIQLLVIKYLIQGSSGNHTTGSRSISPVGHTHPSQSCQVLTLTLWIPGQALIAATSTASFIQNPFVLRQLVYSLFQLTHFYLIVWAH